MTEVIFVLTRTATGYEVRMPELIWFVLYFGTLGLLAIILILTRHRR